ncbi:hypothetical protein BKA70DRAFT_241258 [Coprinopsis sp. MPI-PUGE-AT-0042]|nr:hypothetical protein BKA70DRAFT_241258 [Coprinopsis sp. MPI-PUGE-AT-0042]
MGTPERACYAYRCPSTGDFTIAFRVSLNVAHDQPTPNGQTFSYFLRLSKQPTPAYHYAVAPLTLPSLNNALNLAIHAHDEWINIAGQFTQNRASISKSSQARAFVVFLSILKKADSPLDRGIYTLVAQGRMCTDKGHGGGDEEDEDDNRRQRAHWTTPEPRS